MIRLILSINSDTIKLIIIISTKTQISEHVMNLGEFSCWFRITFSPLFQKISHKRTELAWMWDFSCYRSRFARGCKRWEEKENLQAPSLWSEVSLTTEQTTLSSLLQLLLTVWFSSLVFFLFYRFLCYLHLLNKSIHMRSGSDLSKSLVRFVLNLVNQSADGLNKMTAEHHKKGSL